MFTLSVRNCGVIAIRFITRSMSTVKLGCENPKPYPPEGYVDEVIKNLYGLKVKACKELDSYDDRNYHVIVEENHFNSFIQKTCKDGYILKIFNHIESKLTPFQDAQIALLEHQKEKGFKIPEIVKTLMGELKSLENILVDRKDEDQTGESERHDYVMRLQTFIPGIIIQKVPYTADLMYQVGKLGGQFDKCLSDFTHPAFTQSGSRWYFSGIPTVMDFIGSVKDPEKAAVIKSIIQAYHHEVEPNLSKLSQGVIHGDMNEQNTLVVCEDEALLKYKVTAFIDFGDSHYAPYVWEISMMMAYMMLDSKVLDPITAAGHVLAGYLSEIKLNAIEMDVLKTCMAARLAQSITYGAHTYEQNPTNNYVLTTAKTGWQMLLKLWQTPKEELYKQWREIIASYEI